MPHSPDEKFSPIHPCLQIPLYLDLSALKFDLGYLKGLEPHKVCSRGRGHLPQGRVLYPGLLDLRKGEATLLVILASQSSGSGLDRFTEMSGPMIESGRDGCVCAYLSGR